MIQVFIIIALVLAFALLMYRFATEVKVNEVLEKKNIDLEKENAALYKQISEVSYDIMNKERQLSDLETVKDKVTCLEGQIKQIEESRDDYVDEYHKTKAELNRFKFPECHNLVYGQQIVLDHNYAYFRRIDGDAVIVMRPEQTTPPGGSFMLKVMDNAEPAISLHDFESGLIAGTITLTPNRPPVKIKEAGDKL